MIRKILIANRGEIVNRIIRASEKLGITPVVLFSEADSGLDYLDHGPEKHLLAGSTIASTWLNSAQIISIAKKCGADAIHPGYGFLSENADFALECVRNGITWIGPSPAVMKKMSGKESSRQLAISAGVRVMEAFGGTPDELLEHAQRFSYPLLVKAVSGGGGRGMRIIQDPSQFKDQIETASHEALHFFGDPRIFIESYIEKAKHIEVQVIGDRHGSLVHLFERECTVQRRYQKIIEESPSPSITDPQREHILRDAVKLARLSGYDSAGTLEFLLDSTGQHYFMEMNTRIQVEHPVTEMVTGIDLVAEQIQVAAGNPLSVKQTDIHLNGHSVECRICAENPASHFDPRPGRISLFRYPAEAGIRADHAIGKGFEVSTMYDSLLAKIIVHAPDRTGAIEKMTAALNQTVVHGVETTLEFVREIIMHQDFSNTRFYTGFIGEQGPGILTAISSRKAEPPAEVYQAAFRVLTNSKPDKKHPNVALTPWTSTGYWRQLEGILMEYQENRIRIFPNGKNEKPNDRIICSTHPDRSVWVTHEGDTWQITDPAWTRRPGNRPEKTGTGTDGPEMQVSAPLPGLLSRLLVKSGDRVLKGEPVAIIESMKTENRILAGSGGRIAAIIAAEGQQLRMNELILEIENN